MDIREQISQLWSEYSRLDEFYQKFAVSHDLSMPEIGILHEAWFSGSTTQKSVARLWCAPKQVVYNACKKLVKDGWIRMEKSDDDRRMQKLYLTEAGKEKAGLIVQEFAALEARLFGALSPAEFKILIELITKLADKAQKLEASE